MILAILLAFIAIFTLVAVTAYIIVGWPEATSDEPSVEIPAAEPLTFRRSTPHHYSMRMPDRLKLRLHREK